MGVFMKFFKRIVLFCVLGLSFHLFSMNQDLALTTLQLPQHPTSEQIHTTYTRQALTHHPDRGGDTARFQILSAAHQFLTQPQSQEQPTETLTIEAPANTPKNRRSSDLTRFEDPTASHARTTRAPKPPTSRPPKKDSISVEIQTKEISTTLPKTDQSIQRSFEQEEQALKTKALVAWGATTTVTTIALALKLAAQHQEPNPAHVRRGMLGEVAGVATGGISTAVGEIGSKALIVGAVAAGAYGLKQLSNLVTAPLKHATQERKAHEQQLERERNANSLEQEKLLRLYRKSVEDSETMIKNHKDETERELDRINEQADEIRRQVDAQGRVVKKLDQRASQQGIATNSLTQALKKLQRRVEKNAEENKEDLQVAQALVAHSKKTDARLHVITKALQQLMRQQPAESDAALAIRPEDLDFSLNNSTEVFVPEDRNDTTSITSEANSDSSFLPTNRLSNEVHHVNRVQTKEKPRHCCGLC